MCLVLIVSNINTKTLALVQWVIFIMRLLTIHSDSKESMCFTWIKGMESSRVFNVIYLAFAMTKNTQAEITGEKLSLSQQSHWDWQALPDPPAQRACLPCSTTNFRGSMFATMIYVIYLHKSQTEFKNNLQSLKGEQHKEVNGKAKQPGIAKKRQASRKRGH